MDSLTVAPQLVWLEEANTDQRVTSLFYNKDTLQRDPQSRDRAMANEIPTKGILKTEALKHVCFLFINFFQYFSWSKYKVLSVCKVWFCLDKKRSMIYLVVFTCQSTSWKRQRIQESMSCLRNFVKLQSRNMAICKSSLSNK